MLYYPQLATGAISQFPVTRTATMRTVTNHLLSGDTIRMSDPAATMIRWELKYSGLTDEEWSSLEQLFEAVEGQLNTFAFLDPTDNLLAWSEDWTKSVWNADPMLQITTGIADPLGGNGAVQITNNGQATQGIVQNIAAPSWFQYCFSVYLRSAAPTDVQLIFSSTGQESMDEISVTSSWTRVVMSDRLSLHQDGIGFGLQLATGTQIYAFGAQVEPQPAAGLYMSTTDRAGVYSATRFDSDSVAQTTTTTNQNACTVSLVSTVV